MKNFRWDKKYLYWGMTAFCVIIACIIFFMAIQRWPQILAGLAVLTRVLGPIVWGFILTYLLSPLCRTLERHVFAPLSGRFIKKKLERARRAARALSVLFSVLIMGSVVFTILWLVLPQLYFSIQSIVPNLGTYSVDVIEWIKTLFEGSPEHEAFFTQMLGEITEYFSNWIRGSLLPQMGDIVSVVTGGVVSFLSGILSIFVGIVFACYLLYNKESFGAQAKKLLFAVLRPEWAVKLLRALSFTDSAFTSYISGQILDALLVGVLCYIGTAILGIPYAVLVSVIIAVTNVIPFFGPFIGVIPSAIIILMVSPLKCLIFVIFILVLQQVDGNIIAPRIIGSTTGLNGFWVMFAIIVGGGLFGFVGMLCGVPVFTVLYAAIKSLITGRLKKRGLPTQTARYVDVEELMDSEEIAGDLARQAAQSESEDEPEAEKTQEKDVSEEP